MKPSIRIQFCDFWHAPTPDVIRNNPLFKLLSTRFYLRLSDNPDFVLYSSFGIEHRQYCCTRIFYTGENVRPNFQECDFSFSFDFSADERNYRYPLYGLYNYRPLLAPKNADELLNKKTKFCAFVYSNPKATERVKFMQKLSRYKSVDCGGVMYNNIGYRVKDKVEFMRAYKFSIAFENSSWPGYSTEKLPEAMLANTVPIYWGNTLVERDFNTQAFVNSHDFPNMDAVMDFVVELDKNDALYRQYLGAPAFKNNLPNEFIDEARLLDRFEHIFTNPPIQPVGGGLKQRLKYATSLLRLYRRRRRSLKSSG